MLIKKINYALVSVISLSLLVSWSNFAINKPYINQNHPAYQVQAYQRQENYPVAPAAGPIYYQGMPPVYQRPADEKQQQLAQGFQEYEIEKQKLEEKQRQLVREAVKHTYESKHRNKLNRFNEKDGFIWFKDKHNKYTAFLTNSYPSSIYIWSMSFPCAESAYQAAKFLHRPDLAIRFTQLNGEDAWALGHSLVAFQRPDWDAVKETIMSEVLRAKFRQNPELGDLLVATETAYLVQHRKKDKFWSDNGDGRGENRLGNLLMLIRAEMGGVGPVAKPYRYRKFVR